METGIGRGAGDQGAASQIDARTFWKVMSNRAVGVSIGTAADERGPAGFLALSATHLSADPPVLLVSVNKHTAALQPILKSRHFAINYLAEGAGKLAQDFGGATNLKGSARFEQGRWTTLVTGAPIYTDALVALDCELIETIDRFNVTLAIGRLVAFATAPERRPLISFQGQYG